MMPRRFVRGKLQRLLQAIIESDFLKVVRLIEKEGADVNGRVPNGRVPNGTPLHYAARKGNVQMVKYLIAKGAKTDSRWVGQTPIYDAVCRGHVGVVGVLLDAGDCVEGLPGEDSLLQIAVSYNFTEMVRFLITRGADVNRCNQLKITILHYAARFNKAEMIGVLVSGGAEVNARNLCMDTPLHAAVESESKDAVRALIGAEGIVVDAINRKRNTPLQCAVQKGFCSIARVLVEEGRADINVLDSLGDRIIHLAAREGHVEVVRMCLDRGAPVEILTTRGLTSLQLAVVNNNKKVARELMRRQACLGVVYPAERGSLLHMASNKDMVPFLLREGLDPEKLDRNMRTPLQSAAGKISFGRQGIRAQLEEGASFGSECMRFLNGADRYCSRDTADWDCGGGPSASVRVCFSSSPSPPSVDCRQEEGVSLASVRELIATFGYKEAEIVLIEKCGAERTKKLLEEINVEEVDVGAVSGEPEEVAGSGDDNDDAPPPSGDGATESECELRHNENSNGQSANENENERVDTKSGHDLQGITSSGSGSTEKALQYLYGVMKFYTREEYEAYIRGMSLEEYREWLHAEMKKTFKTQKSGDSVIEFYDKGEQSIDVNNTDRMIENHNTVDAIDQQLMTESSSSIFSSIGLLSVSDAHPIGQMHTGYVPVDYALMA